MDTAEGIKAIDRADSLDALESVRLHYLGKKGLITEALKGLGARPKEVRTSEGAALNVTKKALLAAINVKRDALKEAEEAASLREACMDVTRPACARKRGHFHPIRQTTEVLRDVFESLGFTTVTGPEIEDDYHNFTALNIPDYHPARAMHDTFYLPGALLRTHTSSVQIRCLASQSLPLRIITPGRVYRCDSDPTHTPQFHQLEGLVVSEDASLAEMITVLKAMLAHLFGDSRAVRLRPSYFPFTEPSYEMDLAWGDDWLEVLGCGMVHPNVLAMQGIDTTRYRGYAFGLGIDRFTMLRYGIKDLRSLFENDLDLLTQF